MGKNGLVSDKKKEKKSQLQLNLSGLVWQGMLLYVYPSNTNKQKQYMIDIFMQKGIVMRSKWKQKENKGCDTSHCLLDNVYKYGTPTEKI